MNAPAEAKVLAQHVILGFEDWMFPDLVEMLVAYHAESPSMKAFEFSDEKVETVLRAAIMSPGVLGSAAIDWDARKIEGMIIAATGSVFYSDEPIANVITLYVTPEKRGQGISKLLLSSYEKWAKRLGISKLFFEQTSAIEVERTEEHFKSMGWQHCGSSMFRDIVEKKK